MTSESPTKKLFRSKSNRFIGGVSGGLGNYFNIDANIFRILFVVFTFVGGIGLILYILSLFLVPEDPSNEEEQVTSKQDKTNFIAILFIVIGVLLLVKNMGWFDYFRFWHISWSSIWAIFLIILGFLLIVSSRKSGKEGESEASGNFSFPDINKIHRSNQRMLAGVCGGIAEYFRIDPSIVRILWVIASIGTVGLGILVYVILIFVFPNAVDVVE